MSVLLSTNPMFSQWEYVSDELARFKRTYEDPENPVKSTRPKLTHEVKRLQQ